MTGAYVFEVEQAGCESCARRVRDAISSASAVASVEIDEQRDEATVTLAPGAPPSEESLNELLAVASEGSGHTYRVRPGSLRIGT